MKKVDRLNGLSYAYRYKDIDSVIVNASHALSISDSIGYSSGKAMAFNQLAFAAIARMHYDQARNLLTDVASSTDNQIELLVADVQMMRICQRQSHNREFYDYREMAERRIRRIQEELDDLSEGDLKRFRYAQTEYHIVSSVYYYYVALTKSSIREMQRIDDEIIKSDTAQYLNYLYNMGSGGMVVAPPQEVKQREFEYLMRCYLLASRNGYKYFEANSLEGLAELMTTPEAGERLMHDNPSALTLLQADRVPGSRLPLELAQRSLHLFYDYGDVYQIAGAYRSLATCYAGRDDYEDALFCLDKALSDKRIDQAPDLVASIHEQLCVVHSAMNNKNASDYSRNRYLDLQEYTRQDKYLESRAGLLETTSRQLTWMIIAVVTAIFVLFFLLWFFNHLYRKGENEDNLKLLSKPLEEWQRAMEKRRHESEERREEMDERREMLTAQIRDNQRRNIELHAKLAMVAGITPLIDRMVSEVRKLVTRQEDEMSRRQRWDYVRELADDIIVSNTLLTQWIQLRQGRLSVRMESFRLQDVFDIVQKSRMGFALKGITLHVEPTPLLVKADRILTLFMVNTLADNARKFTDEGGEVDISATETNDYVEISVRDTGRGIPAEQLPHIFEHKVADGHGFGLVNCRGVIEKYKKTSSRFSQCLLAAESREGEGSRFYFRLPRGVASATLSLMAMLAVLWGNPTEASAGDAIQHESLLLKAKEFADSAYFSNVYGNYSRTLAYADSCRRYLNMHYQLHYPRGRCMMRRYESSPGLAPEIKWYRDSLPTHYQVILDIRNESAVAALALHKWNLYRYNNQIYTRLFKEMSADKGLADYCDTMLQQQTNKNIAVVLLTIMLALILPAYYVLYYRHRLYFRYCVERIMRFNEMLNDDNTDSRRQLAQAKRLADADLPPQLRLIVNKIIDALEENIRREGEQQTSLEIAEENIRRTTYENDNLYVSNAVMENSLSALKHETMYYPSRIKQMTENGQGGIEGIDMEAVKELVEYYRDLYSILSTQALSQADRVAYPVSHVNFFGADVIGNRDLLDMMASILRQALKVDKLKVSVKAEDTQYVTFKVSTPWPKDCQDKLPLLFTPQSLDSIPYLLCRQIIREHSERTNRRGCGISARWEDGAAWIFIVLPAAKNMLK